MSRKFNSLNFRALLYVFMAMLIAVAFFFCSYNLTKGIFERYSMREDVFRENADRHARSLQDYITANHITSMDGKKITAWNDKYYYVSMIIMDDDKMCYNSFVSYLMYYDSLEDEPTQDERNDFDWGSKNLPVYDYTICYEDGIARMKLSGYFDARYKDIRLWISALLSMLAFSISFYILFRKHTKQIIALEHTVNLISSGSYNQKVDESGKTEISSLAAGINEMTETINDLISSEKEIQDEKDRFVKSIAHDLRTPLTVVIGYLEVLFNNPELSRENRTKYIEKALTKANSIAGLANQLFSLDEMNRDMELLPHTFQEISSRGVATIEYLFSERMPDFKAAINVSPDTKVQCNLSLLTRLFDNICTNIYKYADMQEPIVINAELSENGSEIKVSIINTRLIDRTYSTSKGLGLEICRKIMEIHNGTFESYAEDMLYCVNITLPVRH